PGSTGRREVDVESRMPLQPALDGGMFVGGIVVHDQMELFVIGGSIVDQPQEVKPLRMAVTLLAQADYFAVQSIEGGEQRSRSVALVVVRHGPRSAALQRQAGLGTVQGLNLTLLVATQHQRVLGWI